MAKSSTSYKIGHKPCNTGKGKGWIQDGYKFIISEGKEVAEHRVIWEKINGKIPAGHNIHHINGNRLDNRIENLQLVHIGEHNKLHNRGFKKGHEDMVNYITYVKCIKCNYEWKARVEVPKKCRSCGSFKWRKHE